MIVREIVLAKRNNYNDTWMWSVDINQEIKKSIEECFDEYKIIKSNGSHDMISTSNHLRFNSKFNTLVVSIDTVINLFGYDKCLLKRNKK